ncbi:hypothetical protein MCAP1_000154 [Malassezia caprae]|uniref:Uncharacterized protein n=1 Tax=Malassezia caprae TaxID=1381934 RepID=A0AAF0E5S6_9BASI|nr:hypothetical protein MCAP1_000154 [Malassezia caprae]
MTGRHICVQLRALVSFEVLSKTMRRGFSVKKKVEEQTSNGDTQSENAHATDGAITNLVSVDVNNISELAAYIHFLIPQQPLTVIMGVVYVTALLGWSAVVGLILLVVAIPIQAYLTRIQVTVQANMLRATDERLDLATEVLNCIKTVKFFAWESPFERRMSETRLTMATFGVHTLLFKRELTAEKAFTALALFNTLRGPLADLPSMIHWLLSAIVSVRRIDNFLNEPDTMKYEQLLQRQQPTTDAFTSFVKLGFDNATFTHGSEPQAAEEEGHFMLRNLNCQFPTGELSVIVGPVGSEYDDERYHEVLRACALEPDLEILEFHDETEVGEKGTSLSGGQKARIALARAFYSHARHILIDDALSAVDAHTAKHLHQHCFQGPFAPGLSEDEKNIISEEEKQAQWQKQDMLPLCIRVADVGSGFIMAIYYMIGSLYLASSRDLKRIESIQRSPLYTLVGETIAGTITIRAFSDGERVMKQCLSLIDKWNRAFLLLWYENRWLSICCDIAGSGVTFIAALFLLFGESDAALAGFTLSYAILLVEVLLWLVRLYSNVEINMNAVERVGEYISIESETQGGLEPPAHWPTDTGAIHVQDLSVRYGKQFPPALQNVSFTIQPGEKVGIVGRTGSGKSTLSLAFFRFLEAERGSITIDGIDISTLSLAALRRKLTIIPQDSQLFKGTVRSNLDPFQLTDDADMWFALQRCQLALPGPDPHTPGEGSIVKSLDDPVDQGGANFSAGQRQLLSLARGLLKMRDSKVLILDESTANLDSESDALIQLHFTNSRVKYESLYPITRTGVSESHEGSEEKAPPTQPRMGLFQRLKTMMKHYGWWAVGIYMVMSGIDCSLTFLAIHFYAGEKVDELEALLSKWMGPVIKKMKGGNEPKENAFINYVKKWVVVEEKSSDFELLLARLSTEFVLAFAIHKTIMLPVRAGITLMITPPIVRWLVKRGWARPLKQTVSKAT